MSIAVVLAGGTGTRMGHHEPKQFIELAGRTILEHSVAAFDHAPGIDQIVVVSVAEHRDRVQTLVQDMVKVSAVVVGGSTRTESTQRALVALADQSDDTKILIHDAARPLVSQPIIAECLNALDSADAVATVVGVTDTIYAVAGDLITDVPHRAGLRRAQTPQGFRLGVLRRAVEAMLAADPADFTDDITAVLRHLPKSKITMIDGESDNLKVTESADVAVAELLMRSRRAD